MAYLYSRYSGALRVLAACVVLSATCGSVYAQNKTMTIRTWSNPVTRYIHVTYRVPVGAPDEVQITCSWSHAGKDDWHPARVSPLISETGLTLLPDAGRSEWASGRVTERRAAGLERTVNFRSVSGGSGQWTGGCRFPHRYPATVRRAAFIPSGPCTGRQQRCSLPDRLVAGFFRKT